MSDEDDDYPAYTGDDDYQGPYGGGMGGSGSFLEGCGCLLFLNLLLAALIGLGYLVGSTDTWLRARISHYGWYTGGRYTVIEIAVLAIISLLLLWWNRRF